MKRDKLANSGIERIKKISRSNLVFRESVEKGHKFNIPISKENLFLETKSNSCNCSCGSQESDNHKDNKHSCRNHNDEKHCCDTEDSHGHCCEKHDDEKHTSKGQESESKGCCKKK